MSYCGLVDILLTTNWWGGNFISISCFPLSNFGQTQSLRKTKKCPGTAWTTHYWKSCVVSLGLRVAGTEEMYPSRSKCIFHLNWKIDLQKETFFLITQVILSYRARFHRFCSSFMSTEFHLPVTEHRLKQFSYTFQTYIRNVIDLDIYNIFNMVQLKRTWVKFKVLACLLKSGLLLVNSWGQC